jgi:hypothetical protein
MSTTFFQNYTHLEINKCTEFARIVTKHIFPNLLQPGRMTFSGIGQCVALVRTYVSEECIAFIIRVTSIAELGTLAVTNNCSTLHASVASYC